MLAAPAAAKEGEAPSGIANRRFPVGGRLELQLSGTFQMVTQLTQHNGAVVTARYNVNEWLAPELSLMGAVTRITNLGNSVRDAVRPSATGTLTSELGDQGQVRAAGWAAIRYAPVYGKFNLASELPLHFQFYATAGAGGAFVYQESITFCSVPLQNKVCPDGQFRTNVGKGDQFRVAGTAAAGTRVFLPWFNLSLHAEMRGLLFPDTYLTEIDLNDPNSGRPSSNAGFTSLLLFNTGVGYTF